ELAAQPSMQRFVAREFSPGSDQRSDADIDAHIRKTATTVHHPAGTCKMGSAADEFAVVDASVMPDLVSGNINAAVIMIAEKAADLIRGVANQIRPLVQ